MWHMSHMLHMSHISIGQHTRDIRVGLVAHVNTTMSILLCHYHYVTLHYVIRDGAAKTNRDTDWWAGKIPISFCVLPSVAVCCSVLQCVAEYGSVLQCCSALQCVAVCCRRQRVLQKIETGEPKTRRSQVVCMGLRCPHHVTPCSSMPLCCLRVCVGACVHEMLISMLTSMPRCCLHLFASPSMHQCVCMRVCVNESVCLLVLQHHAHLCLNGGCMCVHLCVQSCVCCSRACESDTGLVPLATCVRESHLTKP